MTKKKKLRMPENGNLQTSSWLSPHILKDIFEVRGSIYNLRNIQSFYFTCKKL